MLKDTIKDLEKKECGYKNLIEEYEVKFTEFESQTKVSHQKIIDLQQQVNEQKQKMSLIANDQENLKLKEKIDKLTQLQIKMNEINPAGSNILSFLESRKKDELFDKEIKITVQCENQNKIISWKRKLPLKRLMQDYCSREGHPLEKCNFMFKNTKIVDGDTAESLKMADGEDTIQLNFGI